MCVPSAVVRAAVIYRHKHACKPKELPLITPSLARISSQPEKGSGVIVSSIRVSVFTCILANGFLA